VRVFSHGAYLLPPPWGDLLVGITLLLVGGVGALMVHILRGLSVRVDKLADQVEHLAREQAAMYQLLRDYGRRLDKLEV